ncbi:hypothetical protein CU098_001653 [Rhizopus stolonifer]|uniref:Uncharacterized protein n=1 Tax=Rhizopus stolonifer TaxID=4846 RepID=A0A367KNH6_RHIST|nr:hypothetical protein CU098_001653 [Rhizopus stolonifer]
MKRSATIDTNNSLSLCRYYYTHNTGSSDDVLLNSSATHRTPSDYAAIHPSERYTSPEWIPPRPQIRRQETTRRFSDIENYNPDQNIEELRTEMSEKLQLPQSSLSPSPEDLCQTLLGSHETEEHTNAFPDIYLLLFGFLFFPLWWLSTSQLSDEPL